MNFFHALLLGIIQGLTEFIPVSSTAHLLIGQKLLNIPSDDKTFAFMIIIQLGTVVALILYFWKDIWTIIKAFLQGIMDKKPFEDYQARLGWLVIIATIPALVVGFFLRDVVETMFTEPGTQAGIRLLVSSVLLVSVELLGKRQRTLETADWLDALAVGLFQVLALFPGASRSGSTIAGGMFRGFDRPSAARFAFLMSGPILLAAGAYQSLKVIAMSGTRAFLPYLIIGFAAAAIVGWLSVKWLLSYLNKHSLYVFATYCAIAGILAIIFLR